LTTFRLEVWNDKAVVLKLYSLLLAGNMPTKSQASSVECVVAKLLSTADMQVIIIARGQMFTGKVFCKLRACFW